MKKVVSVIFGILMILNVCYGYTFQVDDGKSKITQQVEAGETVYFGLPGGDDIEYVVTEPEGRITLTDVPGEPGMLQFEMPAENVTITVRHLINYLTVKTSLGEMARFEKRVGEVVEVSAEKIEDYRFVNWNVTGITLPDTTADSITFKVPEKEDEDDGGVVVQANYILDSSVIVASTDNNGIIVPSGTLAISPDETQTYKIIPNEGFAIADVFVNGQSVGAVSSYTLANVTEDHFIMATFEPVWSTVSFVVNGGSLVEDIKVKLGEEYGELPNSEKEGYLLEGWYLDEECERKVSSNMLVTTSGAHFLYANWYELGQSVEFDYTGDVQEYVAPITGIYKLDVYGAGGANAKYGGKGGYSSGYTVLQKGEKVYVVVGGHGKTNDSALKPKDTPGYNGGGNANYGSHGGGGGATHIAKETGTLAELGVENISQILIVAGGGGGYAYDNGDDASYKGGNGGGESGSNSARGDKGGTQTSGAGFGQGGTGKAGGGGGLYGGEGGSDNGHPGGGGSGYIGGVTSYTDGNGILHEASTTVGVGARYADGKAVITLMTE